MNLRTDKLTPSEAELSSMHSGAEFGDQNSPERVASGIVGEIIDLDIEIEDRLGTEQAMQTLIGEFQLPNEAVTTLKDKLVLTSIASYFAETETIEDFGKRALEKEYVADLMMLAFGKHTQFADAIQEHRGFQLSTEREKEIYDQFTQPELTEELDQYVRGSEFSDLRERLGIEEGEEDDFKVRVLSVVSQDKNQAYGLVPSVYDEPEGRYQGMEAIHEGDYRKAYVEGLVKNGQKFRGLLGDGDQVPSAWVSTYEDGSVELCIASPTAEKILYADEHRASYFNEDAWQKDLAFLRHEYVHTQNMLLMNGHAGIGSSLEELRAEHFSGNQGGYTDIKKFFIGMGYLTGYTPTNSFEKNGESAYDQDELLKDIARNVGLEGFLSALTVIPGNYAQSENASTFLRGVVDHDGGVSGSYEKLHERMVRKFGRETVENNISRFVDHAWENLKDNEYITFESWAAYGGVKSFAKLVIDDFRTRYPDESDGHDYGT